MAEATSSWADAVFARSITPARRAPASHICNELILSIIVSFNNPTRHNEHDRWFCQPASAAEIAARKLFEFFADSRPCVCDRRCRNWEYLGYQSFPGATGQ